MHKHHSLNYLEIACRDLVGSKQFFSDVFDWSFTDYPDQKSGEVHYSAFSLGNIDGGFFTSDKVSCQSNGAALIVFYSEDINATQDKIEAADGIISTATFDFPGGRRFHFCDPSGNEFAVWSDQ